MCERNHAGHSTKLDADLFIVEPVTLPGMTLAQAAHIANPSLQMICASAFSPPGDLLELGVVFADCLVKPFTLGRSQAAIELALDLQSVGSAHDRI